MKLPNESLLDIIHPIGSLYWSSKSADPSTLFGGTWERIKDKFILAAGDKYSAGSTGGEATHVLTTSELPKITGDFTISSNVLLNDNNGSYLESATGVFKTTKTTGNVCQSNPGSITSKSISDKVTLSIGGGTAHNNMPPYKTYYCWERIA